LGNENTALVNPCVICLRDNTPIRDEDQNVCICEDHQMFVHIKCVGKLMGANWYTRCPNTFEECHSYQPRLVVGTEKFDLNYSVFSVKKSLYNGWPVSLIVATMLNVFASFSINNCDFQIYQNSCYVAGVISHGMGNLIIALLFFYYQPTVAVYFKYTGNYFSIKRKLKGELFVTVLALVSGIPLLVLLAKVLDTHYILGIWLLIVSGIINPLCCLSICHMLYSIVVQISSTELVFEPVEVVSLSE